MMAGCGGWGATGQFGSRLQGGKDAASPRYIYTRLAPLTRHMFNPADDQLLNYLEEDGDSIEPSWYLLPPSSHHLFCKGVRIFCMMSKRLVN